MNEEADGGSGLHTGLEKRSLERLRELIANFPDGGFRPPVRAAARKLLAEDIETLRKGPVPLELPRRTLSLTHGKTFNPTGPGSAAIDLFTLKARPYGVPITELVRKTVLRAELSEERLGWLGEALFYLEIAPRIALPGTQIPQLCGCRLEEDSVVLVIEYLEPAQTQHADLERIARSARFVGRLGAATYRDQLYKADWIRPVSPRLPPETLLALEMLTANCIPDDSEQKRIVDAFESLIGNPNVVARIRTRGYPSLAHGDLHVRNIFPVAAEPGHLAVIDWGKVCEGLIGHDAVLLLLPRFIGSPEWGGMEFGAAVELVQREVIAGALSIDPSLDPPRIRLGLEIGIVFQAAMLAARNHSKWTRNDGEGERRSRRMASMLRHVADIAETLLCEHRP